MLHQVGAQKQVITLSHLCVFQLYWSCLNCNVGQELILFPFWGGVGGVVKQWELQMSWPWRYDQQRLWICESCVCVSERVSVLTLDFSIFCLKCDLYRPSVPLVGQRSFSGRGCSSGIFGCMLLIRSLLSSISVTLPFELLLIRRRPVSLPPRFC